MHYSPHVFSGNPCLKSAKKLDSGQKNAGMTSKILVFGQTLVNHFSCRLDATDALLILFSAYKLIPIPTNDNLMLQKILILLLYMSSISFSQEEAIDVVVMDLFGQDVTEKNLNELTNVLERELAKTGKFNVTDRARINAVLDEFGVTKKECNTVPWLVRIGRKLGVDKVVAGSVVDRGTVVTVHIRTINVAKQEIDKSATEVCRNCSIDVIFLKKIQHVARVLAGLEENLHVDDSLFYFSPGPLIKLDKGAKDADISTKMGDKLFDGMWQMKSRRNSGVGIFLFGLGTSLLLVHNLLWVGDHPGTMERVGIASADAGLAFLSIIFFNRAKRFGKGINIIEIDAANNNPIKKGVKLGISRTSFDPITYDKENSYQPKPGIILGGFFQFNLTCYFAFQPELLYVQKRIKLEEITTGPTSGNLTLNYFEVPLFLKYQLPLNRKLKPQIKIGIAPSFLTVAKRKYTNIQEKEDEEKIDELKGFDLGFDFCIELEREIKKGAIIFELRFEDGIIELGEFNTISSQKTRTISFLLGYSF